jgi:hypothetical protein
MRPEDVDGMVAVLGVCWCSEQTRQETFLHRQQRIKPPKNAISNSGNFLAGMDGQSS